MALPHKQTAIDDLSGLEDILKTVTKIGEVGGVTIEEINARCLEAVSEDMEGSLSSVQRIIVDGLEKAKKIAKNVHGLPTAVQMEVENLPETLKLASLGSIISKVWELLANFHAAAEDPVRLYSRLVCGSIPVDPAKITKFSKHYRVLERLNEADDNLSGGGMSTSVPPTSSQEVVTRIQASAETLSEAVLEAAEKMSGLEKEFGSLKQSMKSLLEAQKPIEDILHQQEAVYGMVGELQAIFSLTKKVDNIEGEGNSDRVHKGGITGLVQDCSNVLGNIDRSQNSVQDAILKIESLGGFCKEQAEAIAARIEKAQSFLDKLVSVLRNLHASIPRFTRELRHFFMPAGWRACLLTPSPDLLTMLGQIDRLREALPDPDSFQESSTTALAEGDLVGNLSRMKRHFEELARIPLRVINEVREEDLQSKVLASIRKLLLRVLEELNESVTGEVIGKIGGMFGVGDVPGLVGEYFRLGKPRSGE